MNEYGKHHAPDESPKPSRPRADGVPRIAIVRPDLHDQNAVTERIGHMAKLAFLDCQSPARQVPDTDYLIITRHTTHQWWNIGIKVFGRERTFRIDTSGVETVVAKIEELARKALAPSLN